MLTTNGESSAEPSSTVVKLKYTRMIRHDAHRRPKGGQEFSPLISIVVFIPHSHQHTVALIHRKAHDRSLLIKYSMTLSDPERCKSSVSHFIYNVGVVFATLRCALSGVGGGVNREKNVFDEKSLSHLATELDRWLI